MKHVLKALYASDAAIDDEDPEKLQIQAAVRGQIHALQAKLVAVAGEQTLRNFRSEIGLLYTPSSTAAAASSSDASSSSNTNAAAAVIDAIKAVTTSAHVATTAGRANVATTAGRGAANTALTGRIISNAQLVHEVSHLVLP